MLDACASRRDERSGPVGEGNIGSHDRVDVGVLDVGHALRHAIRAKTVERHRRGVCIGRQGGVLTERASVTLFDLAVEEHLTSTGEGSGDRKHRNEKAKQVHGSEEWVRLGETFTQASSVDTFVSQTSREADVATRGVGRKVYATECCSVWTACPIRGLHLVTHRVFRERTVRMFGEVL